MTDDLLSRPLVAVAGPKDARRTARALFERLEPDARPVFVHVIEKAGGAIDKASVEQREQNAEEAFDLVRDQAEDAGVSAETDIVYGTNVADALVAAAADHGASAIVFTPRGGSRFWDIFTDDVRGDLVTGSDRPLVVLPDTDE